MRNRLDARYNDGIAELAVGLSVRHGNGELTTTRTIEAHETCAFPRSQPAGISGALFQENLGAVLVVSSGECPGYVFRAY